MGTLLDRLVSVIAPFSCLRCGIEGKIICARCLPTIATSKQSTCYVCNRLTKNWQVCETCRHKTRLRGAILASHYDGLIKNLIRQPKYHNAVEAASVLGKLMVSLVMADQFDLVMAIPSSSKRYRQRGYNPAQLIAKAVAAELKLPYYDLPQRYGHTRQVGTDRRHRLSQMQNTMYTVGPQRIKNKRIVVLDDVVTTGATITEAGRALKQAGATYIWAAAIAKR